MFTANGRHDNPALTMEGMLRDDEEFQREQTEKLHRDLPGIMAALDDDDDRSFHSDDESEPRQNGNSYAKTNGNHLSENHIRDLELLLDVKSREVKKLEQVMDRMNMDYRKEIAKLTDDLNHVSMEKQRAIAANQENEKKLAVFNETIEERDNYYQQVVALKEQVRMLTLNVNDQDRTIKMLTDATNESTKTTLYEKDLEILKQRHQSEVSNLNHQLELCLQKCKTYEQENFQLEKKIKNLEERNDDMMSQKAATVTKLMTQIQDMEDKLLKKSTSDEYSNLREKLLEAKAAELDLRAQLSIKEVTEKRLRNQLENAQAATYKMRTKDTDFVVDKKVTCSGVQTEPWSADTNNAQYLRFHEEQMSNLREECEERRLADLRKKEEIIENLREEIEQVKKKFLNDLASSVDVGELQRELATSKQRLLELNQMHSDHCIPELENRHQQIIDLQKQVKDLLDKLLVLELSEKTLKEKLAQTEAEIVRHKEEIQNLSQKILVKSPIKPEQRGKVYTEAELTKLLESLGRRHEEEIMNYEAQISKLSSQVSKSDSGSNEPSAELTMELWRKLENLQSDNLQLLAKLRHSQEIENELLNTTEKLKDAQGKAARLKSELLVLAEKYNKARDKFKSTKEQFSHRLTDVQKTMESERHKWEKERERWHDEQEKWENERLLYAKRKNLWETEKMKREKVLLDLQAYVETLKSQETVSAVTKLYDEMISSIKRQK